MKYSSGSQSVLRGSQGIRGYISVMATVKFEVFFKIIAELL
jgi:hypothetical protein